MTESNRGGSPSLSPRDGVLALVFELLVELDPRDERRGPGLEGREILCVCRDGRGCTIFITLVLRSREAGGVVKAVLDRCIVAPWFKS